MVISSDKRKEGLRGAHDIALQTESHYNYSSHMQWLYCTANKWTLVHYSPSR